MTSAAIAELIRMQAPDGSFPSAVTRPGRTLVDHNGFTAAMVLRALRGLPGGDGVDSLRSAALQFIERCRSAHTPGAFGFWPEQMRPAWASRLPADIDDTAIMTMELMRHGRLGLHDGLRTVCSVLIPNRLTGRESSIKPPWIMPGAFLTWIGGEGKPNVIDCCVNANAAALMALVGATHLPGYREAVSTIQAAVAWAGRDPRRQRSITPFYPSLSALHEAVEHAVECGALSLVSTLKQLQALLAEQDTVAPPGCCCSAYGLVVWHCRALDEARGAARAAHPVVGA